MNFFALLQDGMWFLAQEGGAPASGGQSPLDALIPIVLMFVIFYFLLIRPQRKKQKEIQNQVNAMRAGDTVITIGGLHGLVTSVQDKTVMIKVDDGVKLKFEKSSVQSVSKKQKGAEKAIEEGEEEENAS